MNRRQRKATYGRREIINVSLHHFRFGTLKILGTLFLLYGGNVQAKGLHAVD